MMFKHLLLVVLIFNIESALSDECDGKENKVIYNVVFDKQVMAIDNLLAAFNKHYINMNKMKFNVAEGTEADGVRLYNISQLAPENTYIWTKPDNVEGAEINVKLDNATLLINSLKYKGKEYTNANVTIATLSMKIIQITQFSRNSCTEKYEDAEIKRTSKVTLNDQEDVTNDFNDIVVPWINKQLNSQPFLNLALKYFDNCNPESGKNLEELIMGPYSE